MVYLNIFALSVIVVFIIDVSGVIEELRPFVNERILHRDADARLKPFDCSLCMTFWTGVIYVCLFAGFSFPRIAAVCLAAAMVRNIGEAVFIIRKIGEKLLSKLADIIRPL